MTKNAAAVFSSSDGKAAALANPVVNTVSSALIEEAIALSLEPKNNRDVALSNQY